MNPTGLPRPRARFTGSAERTGWTGSLRYPWINAGSVAEPQWLSFRPEDSLRAHELRLCAVCGVVVAGPLVYLNFGWLPSPGARPETSGPGAHPVCALIAVDDCPHLAEQLARRGADTVIGWLWTGPGQAYHLDTSSETGPEEIYGEPLLLEEPVRALTAGAIRALVRRHSREDQDAVATTPTRVGTDSDPRATTAREPAADTESVPFALHRLRSVGPETSR